MEQTPRLAIAQIQRLPEWPEYKLKRQVSFVFSWDGVNHVAQVDLTTTGLTFGERWWFQCRCGGRVAFLHFVDGKLLCRGCGNLLYMSQAWPDARWRKETGRPLLRAARAAVRHRGDRAQQSLSM